MTAGTLFIDAAGSLIFSAAAETLGTSTVLRSLFLSLPSSDLGSILAGLGVPGASGLDAGGLVLSNASVLYVPSFTGQTGEQSAAAAAAAAAAAVRAGSVSRPERTHPPLPLIGASSLSALMR